VIIPTLRSLVEIELLIRFLGIFNKIEHPAPKIIATSGDPLKIPIIAAGITKI